MIGQKKLIQKIDTMVHNSFPRFTIICGEAQSGKKLIAKHITDQLQAEYVSSGIKVDDVRETITLAYKQSEPTVYVFEDADKMSPAAKNALLKVTEEPPRKAYFIITVTDPNNTLETLRSRGCLLHMDSYSQMEIQEYVDLKGYSLNREELSIVKNTCTTPGMIDKLVSYDINKFYEFTNMVVENVGSVSGVNAFKITQRFDYKDDGNGWDLKLFLKMLMLNYCLRMVREQDSSWYYCALIVSKYIQQLNTTGINKSATVDMMILELRGAQ